MWQSLALPESTNATNAVPSTQDDILHFELQHLLPEVTRASQPEGFASPDNQPRTCCSDDIEDDRTVHGGSNFKFLAPPRAHTRKTKPQPTGIGPDAFRRNSGSRPSTACQLPMLPEEVELGNLAPSTAAILTQTSEWTTAAYAWRPRQRPSHSAEF